MNNRITLSDKQKHQILDSVDQGGWKFSWHMERDRWGNIDFHNEKNLETIQQQLESEIAFHEEMIKKTRESLEIFLPFMRQCELDKIEDENEEPL